MSYPLGDIPVTLSDWVAEDQVVAIEGGTVFMHLYTGARVYSSDLIEQLRFILRYRIQVAMERFDRGIDIGPHGA